MDTSPLELTVERAVTLFLAGLRKDLVRVAREAGSPWKDRAAAAQYLGVEPCTVDRWKRIGKLTPHYIGSKPYFSVTDLDKLPTKDKKPDEPTGDN